MFTPTEWRFRQRQGDRIIWASEIGDVDVALHSKEYAELVGDQPWTPNSFTDELEQDILDVYFRAATAPTEFYIRLCNDTLADTDSLADVIGEPSGNGYTAQLIERSATGFPTLALDGGDYQLTSSTETFTASGGAIGPVTQAYLATTSNNTGLLLNYVALSQSRTLADGESLDATIRIKQS